MAYQYILFIVSFYITLTSTSPIMVKFGTSGGPILPAIPTTTHRPPPGSYPSQPAPVYENQNDIPNPVIYKPLTPHQYRKKIYSYKPSPNLILGTALDRKYTPGLGKFVKPQKAIGLGFTGPQVFGHEEYQRLDSGKSQIHRNYYSDQQLTGSKTVPQIGVLFSSGLRYYVPQLNYYGDDIDNSVYEANDLKYYYHNRKNY